MRASSLAVEAFKKHKGIYQWWKKPIDVAPVLSPLQRGPDFSFVDGRKPAITSKIEFEWRKNQVELAKRVIRYLSEIKEAERLFDEKQLNDDIQLMKIEQQTLKSKGDCEIS